METPQFQLFALLLLLLLLPLLPLLLHHTVLPALELSYFAAATVQQRLHIKLFALWRPRAGASSVCIAWADHDFVSSYTRNRNEHIISRAMKLSLRRHDIKRHILGISQAIAQPRDTLFPRRQQRRNSSNSSSCSCSCST